MMTFDTLKLSNDLQDAYEELNKERQKVFDGVELQIEKKRAYDEKIAELRRGTIEGKNKDEREANLKKLVESEAKSLEAANGHLRKLKFDHETALLLVEHLRAQIRILENIDRVKGR
jgi:hypothetical protein